MAKDYPAPQPTPLVAATAAVKTRDISNRDVSAALDDAIMDAIMELFAALQKVLADREDAAVTLAAANVALDKLKAQTSPSASASLIAGEEKKVEAAMMELDDVNMEVYNQQTAFAEAAKKLPVTDLEALLAKLGALALAALNPVMPEKTTVDNFQVKSDDTDGMDNSKMAAIGAGALGVGALGTGSGVAASDAGKGATKFTVSPNQLSAGDMSANAPGMSDAAMPAMHMDSSMAAPDPNNALDAKAGVQKGLGRGNMAALGTDALGMGSLGAGLGFLAANAVDDVGVVTIDTMGMPIAGEMPLQAPGMDASAAAPGLDASADTKADKKEEEGMGKGTMAAVGAGALGIGALGAGLGVAASDAGKGAKEFNVSPKQPSVGDMSASTPGMSDAAMSAMDMDASMAAPGLNNALDAKAGVQEGLGKGEMAALGAGALGTAALGAGVGVAAANAGDDAGGLTIDTGEFPGADAAMRPDASIAGKADDQDVDALKAASMGLFAALQKGLADRDDAAVSLAAAIAALDELKAQTSPLASVSQITKQGQEVEQAKLKLDNLNTAVYNHQTFFNEAAKKLPATEMDALIAQLGAQALAALSPVMPEKTSVDNFQAKTDGKDGMDKGKMAAIGADALCVGALGASLGVTAVNAGNDAGEVTINTMGMPIAGDMSVQAPGMDASAAVPGLDASADTKADKKEEESMGKGMVAAGGAGALGLGALGAGIGDAASGAGKDATEFTVSSKQPSAGDMSANTPGMSDAAMPAMAMDTSLAAPGLDRALDAKAGVQEGLGKGEMAALGADTLGMGTLGAGLGVSAGNADDDVGVVTINTMGMPIAGEMPWQAPGMDATAAATGLNNDLDAKAGVQEGKGEVAALGAGALGIGALGAGVGVAAATAGDDAGGMTMDAADAAMGLDASIAGKAGNQYVDAMKAASIGLFGGLQKSMADRDDAVASLAAAIAALDELKAQTSPPASPFQIAKQEQEFEQAKLKLDDLNTDVYNHQTFSDEAANKLPTTEMNALVAQLGAQPLAGLSPVMPEKIRFDNFQAKTDGKDGMDTGKVAAVGAGALGVGALGEGVGITAANAGNDAGGVTITASGMPTAGDVSMQAPGLSGDMGASLPRLDATMATPGLDGSINAPLAAPGLDASLDAKDMDTSLAPPGLNSALDAKAGVPEGLGKGKVAAHGAGALGIGALGAGVEITAANASDDAGGVTMNTMGMPIAGDMSMQAPGMDASATATGLNNAVDEKAGVQEGLGKGEMAVLGADALGMGSLGAGLRVSGTNAVDDVGVVTINTMGMPIAGDMQDPGMDASAAASGLDASADAKVDKKEKEGMGKRTMAAIGAGALGVGALGAGIGVAAANAGDGTGGATMGMPTAGDMSMQLPGMDDSAAAPSLDASDDAKADKKEREGKGKGTMAAVGAGALGLGALGAGLGVAPSKAGKGAKEFTVSPKQPSAGDMSANAPGMSDAAMSAMDMDASIAAPGMNKALYAKAGVKEGLDKGEMTALGAGALGGGSLAAGFGVAAANAGDGAGGATMGMPSAGDMSMQTAGMDAPAAAPSLDASADAEADREVKEGMGKGTVAAIGAGALGVGALGAGLDVAAANAGDGAGGATMDMPSAGDMSMQTPGMDASAAAPSLDSSAVAEADKEVKEGMGKGTVAAIGAGALGVGALGAGIGVAAANAGDGAGGATMGMPTAGDMSMQAPAMDASVAAPGLDASDDDKADKKEKEGMGKGTMAVIGAGALGVGALGAGIGVAASNSGKDAKEFTVSPKQLSAGDMPANAPGMSDASMPTMDMDASIAAPGLKNALDAKAGVQEDLGEGEVGALGAGVGVTAANDAGGVTINTSSMPTADDATMRAPGLSGDMSASVPGMDTTTAAPGLDGSINASLAAPTLNASLDVKADDSNSMDKGKMATIGSVPLGVGALGAGLGVVAADAGNDAGIVTINTMGMPTAVDDMSMQAPGIDAFAAAPGLDASADAKADKKEKEGMGKGMVAAVGAGALGVGALGAGLGVPAANAGDDAGSATMGMPTAGDMSMQAPGLSGDKSASMPGTDTTMAAPGLDGSINAPLAAPGLDSSLLAKDMDTSLVAPGLNNTLDANVGVQEGLDEGEMTALGAGALGFGGIGVPAANAGDDADGVTINTMGMPTAGDVSPQAPGLPGGMGASMPSMDSTMADLGLDDSINASLAAPGLDASLDAKADDPNSMDKCKMATIGADALGLGAQGAGLGVAVGNAGDDAGDVTISSSGMPTAGDVSMQAPGLYADMCASMPGMDATMAAPSLDDCINASLAAHGLDASLDAKADDLDVSLDAKADDSNNMDKGKMAAIGAGALGVGALGAGLGVAASDAGKDAKEFTVSPKQPSAGDMSANTPGISDAAIPAMDMDASLAAPGLNEALDAKAGFQQGLDKGEIPALGAGAHGSGALGAGVGAAGATAGDAGGGMTIDTGGLPGADAAMGLDASIAGKSGHQDVDAIKADSMGLFAALQKGLADRDAAAVSLAAAIAALDKMKAQTSPPSSASQIIKQEQVVQKAKLKLDDLDLKVYNQQTAFADSAKKLPATDMNSLIAQLGAMALAALSPVMPEKTVADNFKARGDDKDGVDMGLMAATGAGALGVGALGAGLGVAAASASDDSGGVTINKVQPSADADALKKSVAERDDAAKLFNTALASLTELGEQVPTPDSATLLADKQKGLEIAGQKLDSLNMEVYNKQTDFSVGAKKLHTQYLEALLKELCRALHQCPKNMAHSQRANKDWICTNAYKLDTILPFPGYGSRPRSSRTAFERGMTDTFAFDGVDVTTVGKLMVVLRPNGMGDGWNLESVTVTHMKSGVVTKFPYGGWFNSKTGWQHTLAPSGLGQAEAKETKSSSKFFSFGKKK
eukprot:gene6557-3211_t